MQGDSFEKDAVGAAQGDLVQQPVGESDARSEVVQIAPAEVAFPRASGATAGELKGAGKAAGWVDLSGVPARQPIGRLSHRQNVVPSQP